MTADWQPIETAPKDGTRILGWDGYSAEVTWWGESSVYANEANQWCFGEQDGEYNIYSCFCPTHWLPLPEDPPATA